MAKNKELIEMIKYINPNYEMAGMFFQNAAIEAIVVVPDQKLAVLTDIPQGVLQRMGNFQPLQLEDGVELDARNYYIITKEGRQNVQTKFN